MMPAIITYDAWSQTDISTLDPQIAADSVSSNYIENLFVQLTNYELGTADIVPEAATEWEVSEDGLTYTFHIRPDIPWVYYDPTSGKTTQVKRPLFDQAGKQTGEEPAFVTANDFVYGIKRACDPNIDAYYSSIIAPLIAGCNEMLNTENPANIPQAMFDAIGVSAPDDSTLVVKLAFRASYFLSMTPMWTLTATPEWAIVANGNSWIEAGNIVTSGRYVLEEWVHGVHHSIVRNELMPQDLQGAGNIERVITTVVPDSDTGYALWLNNEVDISTLPYAKLAFHLDEYPDETLQVPTLAVYSIAFRTTKPPFDDARVRRAFSAAFDRETFVAIFLQGLPMRHFAPPGIFGAPPIGEVGLGFDAEFAAAQLELAGYPNCQGFPTVTLLAYSGQDTLDWIEYAKQQWSEILGCSPDLFQVEQRPFAEVLAATAADVPDEAAPHMWTLARGPDYPDENNWVGDVLWCEADNRPRRACTRLDELIVEARLEQNPDARTDLYRRIEGGFFGPEGEMPIFPVY
ncbi:MAG: peptide ABC transporter substrate-binding protein, partial [Caldilineaceae bacterium]|nr:peptide ABC transporter substrate-binding protein [Caldilineaceae bacterium]